uniref:Uncharacterized protein n=1 Tax=Timema cristinae TaxID=61476 RepID=A0A7R9CFU6_TIMCR|nr:unnamed protein product [Timema cristinae]
MTPYMPDSLDRVTIGEGLPFVSLQSVLVRLGYASLCRQSGPQFAHASKNVDPQFTCLFRSKQLVRQLLTYRPIRLHKQPYDCYASMAASRKASSWEESEAVQRRRSVVLATAAAAVAGGGGGLLSATECNRSHLRGGDMIILPASSELMMMDKRDLRYYFQHPYARLFVTYFVIFCNFLLFAEDPISHSHTDIPAFVWRKDRKPFRKNPLYIRLGFEPQSCHHWKPDYTRETEYYSTVRESNNDCQHSRWRVSLAVLGAYQDKTEEGVGQWQRILESSSSPPSQLALPHTAAN